MKDTYLALPHLWWDVFGQLWRFIGNWRSVRR